MTAIDNAVIVTLWAIIIIHAIKLRNGAWGRQSNWTRSAQVTSSKSRGREDAKLHVGHSATSGETQLQQKMIWRKDGNTNVFSHSAGGHKSKVKVLAGPCSLSRLQGRIIPQLFQILVAAANFLVPWCVDASLPSASIFLSPSFLGPLPFSYKDTCHPNSGQSHLKILNLVTTVKTPHSGGQISLRRWGVVVGERHEGEVSLLNALWRKYPQK